MSKSPIALIHRQSICDMGLNYYDFEWYGYMTFATVSDQPSAERAVELLRETCHFKEATHVFSANVTTYREGHPGNNYWHAKVEGDFGKLIRKREPATTSRERVIDIGGTE